MFRNLRMKKKGGHCPISINNWRILLFIVDYYFFGTGEALGILVVILLRRRILQEVGMLLRSSGLDLVLHGLEDLIEILVEMLFERGWFEANVFSHPGVVGMRLRVTDIISSSSTIYNPKKPFIRSHQ